MNVAPMIEKKVSHGLESRILALLESDYNFIVGRKVQQMFATDLVQLVHKTTRADWQLDPGQTLWLAVDVNQKHHLGRRRSRTKFVPVILTIVCEEDINRLKEGYSLRELRRYKVVRLFTEAYEQGGVLTHSDVAHLLHVSTGTVGRDVNSYMEETDRIVPTRGIIHDLGPGVTHKAIIIHLYEEGLMLPEIARRTNHSEQSCQRYISAYERVRLAANNHSLDKICRLLGMSHGLVRQYVALLREHGHDVSGVDA